MLFHGIICGGGTAAAAAGSVFPDFSSLLLMTSVLYLENAQLQLTSDQYRHVGRHPSYELGV